MTVQHIGLEQTSTEQIALIALLQEQVDLYRKLLSLADTQKKYVQAQDAEQLLGILAARKMVIDQLAQVNQKLTPYRQRWDDVFASLPADQKQQVKQLVLQTQNALATIIKQDEQDRASMESAKNKMGNELQRVSRGNMAARAYGQVGVKTIPKLMNSQG